MILYCLKFAQLVSENHVPSFFFYVQISQTPTYTTDMSLPIKNRSEKEILPCLYLNLKAAKLNVPTHHNV